MDQDDLFVPSLKGSSSSDTASVLSSVPSLTVHSSDDMVTSVPSRGFPMVVGTHSEINESQIKAEGKVADMTHELSSNECTEGEGEGGEGEEGEEGEGEGDGEIQNCPFASCQKEFTSRWSLTRHIRTHTGEKPFKCSVCGKEFVQKCTLKRHANTHTQEKQWICDHHGCGKRFKLKEYLDVHKRTHVKIEAPLRPENEEHQLVQEAEDAAGALIDQLRQRLVRMSVRHRDQILVHQQRESSLTASLQDCSYVLAQAISLLNDRNPGHVPPYMVEASMRLSGALILTSQGNNSGTGGIGGSGGGGLDGGGGLGGGGSGSIGLGGGGGDRLESCRELSSRDSREGREMYQDGMVINGANNGRVNNIPRIPSSILRNNSHDNTDMKYDDHDNDMNAKSNCNDYHHVLSNIRRTNNGNDGNPNNGNQNGNQNGNGNQNNGNSSVSGIYLQGVNGIYAHRGSSPAEMLTYYRERNNM